MGENETISAASSLIMIMIKDTIETNSIIHSAFSCIDVRLKKAKLEAIEVISKDSLLLIFFIQ